MMTTKAFEAQAWNNTRGLRAFVLLNNILGVNYRSLKESSPGKLLTEILVVTKRKKNPIYIGAHHS